MNKKMKVLLTGGSGFIGKNILPILSEKYDVFAPSRAELDLLNEKQVEEYVKNGNFDVVIHGANTNPVKNRIDEDFNLLDGSLRCFMNLYRVRNYCGKLYFLGSGAEFGKTADIRNIREEEFDRMIPADEYGFAKYIMNSFAEQSENVYNIRVFAIYGPMDHPSKFITHCINSVKENVAITVRKDCYFDYLHINDFANIMQWFIEHTPLYHSYNVSSGEVHLLSEIAQIVKERMQSNLPISILSDGLNHEYTANNSRLLNEMGSYTFISLRDGIDMQIESLR